ncbi:uncharacterized protein A1O5_12615 [Cladophialophora psammophila CBS 110553]|uniref:SH3 domain-containing protein n=1 Tax=Cladophialophora psammophila CBS 110553 TaxID=1182543 RepID=W9VLH0_9EURO|nr:uncharacterized protein A1O5_12615 [Cladophialophora psammophila CBS 110553]EXJ56348.1 hypothetical protein A1O5_12615 [Cladophialophora psammophila CBS 110553]
MSAPNNDDVDITLANSMVAVTLANGTASSTPANDTTPTTPANDTTSTTPANDTTATTPANNNAATAPGTDNVATPPANDNMATTPANSGPYTFPNYPDFPRILFRAMSEREFNLSEESQPGPLGLRYLTYVLGEAFDIIAVEGDMWLAINQDDESRRMGWIWNKDFVRMPADWRNTETDWTD